MFFVFLNWFSQYIKPDFCESLTPSRNKVFQSFTLQRVIETEGNEHSNYVVDSVTFWRQTLLFTVLYFKRESCLSNSVANVNVIYPLESVFLTTCRSPKGWLTLWRFQQQFVAVNTIIRGFQVDKSAQYIHS